MLVLMSAVAFAQPELAEILEGKVLQEVRKVEEREVGVVGFAALDLTSQRMFSYHGDTLFAQASSIKIPILIEMYRAAAGGKFRMDDKLTLNAKDAVGGSGTLREKLLAGPLTLSVKDIVTAMMESSDNSATNQCIRMVGMDNVNRTMDSYGMKKTRLQRMMMDSSAAQHDAENISTPHEMVRIVELLYRGKAVTPQASAEMIEILKLVKAHFKKAIPNVVIASKPGGISGVKCETGIVYLQDRPYALSVMTTFVTDESDAVEQVAAIVHRHFALLAKSNSYGNHLRP